MASQAAVAPGGGSSSSGDRALTVIELIKRAFPEPVRLSPFQLKLLEEQVRGLEDYHIPLKIYQLAKADPGERQKEEKAIRRLAEESETPPVIALTNARQP
jgi:hypothetical protein